MDHTLTSKSELSVTEQVLWDRTVSGDIYGEIDFTKMSRVLDVGAHIGAFAVWAATSGAASVLAYEACPERHRRLALNAEEYTSITPILGTVGLSGGYVRPVQPESDCAPTPVLWTSRKAVPCIGLRQLLGESEVDLVRLNVGESVFAMLRQPGVVSLVKNVIGDYVGPDRRVLSLVSFLKRHGFTARAYRDGENRGKFFAFRQ